MHAWLMDSYEGVEKLRWDEVPEPQPGPGQAVLKLIFAALNPADAFLALAQYPAKPACRMCSGRDGVGEVVAVGAGVERRAAGRDSRHSAWRVPDRDRDAVGEDGRRCFPTWFRCRRAGSVEEFAGAPLVFLTAWQVLYAIGAIPLHRRRPAPYRWSPVHRGAWVRLRFCSGSRWD